MRFYRESLKDAIEPCRQPGQLCAFAGGRQGILAQRRLGTCPAPRVLDLVPDVPPVGDQPFGDAEQTDDDLVGVESVATVQHGRDGGAARSGLLDVLRSGMVAPLNGRAVPAALETREDAGLLDRLIAEEYSRVGLEALTLDRRMATLPGVRRL